MPETEYKALEIKELSDQGQIKALISTFGRDRDGDVMTRAAFKDADGQSIPMVWSHNWDMPIGKGMVSVGAKGATFEGAFFLDTYAGNEAYKAVKAMGELQQYSIGFRVKDADFGYEEDDAGNKVYTRTIKDLELFEASPVLVGAAYGTRTLAVKTAEEPKEDIHELLKAALATHAAECEHGDDCAEIKALLPEVGQQDEPEDDEDAYDQIDPERAKAIREMEAALGYRPLIAERI